MNLFHEMTKKPWLVDPTEASGVREVGAFFLPAGKVGLRVFLVVVTVVFTLITIAYADRMLFANWLPMPEPCRSMPLNRSVSPCQPRAWLRSASMPNEARPL